MKIQGKLKVDKIDLNGKLIPSPVSGGTTDYEKLENLPLINDVQVIGNNDGKYYGLVDLKDYNLKQANQDELIEKNKTDLSKHKQEQAKKDNQQDLDIQANALGIETLQDDLLKHIQAQETKDQEQDNAIAGVASDLETYKAKVTKEQTAQDVLINANKNYIDSHEVAFNEFKQAQETEQTTQNANIQANALAIQDKVGKEEYEATELDQNNAIKKNKEDIDKTNKTLETYKSETTKGFQDERELSEKDKQEVIELANTKAAIDDLHLSSDKAFSSLESAERFTCKRTYKGANVEFEPIEDYPMSVIANVKAVRRDDNKYVGWQNVDITQDNGGTHKEYNQQLNRPCFGGYFDFNKGELTITSQAEELAGTEDTWSEIKLTNGRKHQFALRNYITNASNDLAKQFCDKYTVPSIMPEVDFNGVWIKDNTLYIGGVVADVYPTLQDWKDYLIQNPLQVGYGLQAPTKEQYEPQLIKGQTGINKLYANSGDIEVTTNVKPICAGEGGKVDGIRLNGQLLIPDIDKVVDIDVITDKEVDVKIATAVAAIPTLQFEIVDELPAVGEKTKIYLVPIKARKDNNGYTEWAYINDKWELLGSTEIDLSNVVQKSDILEVAGNASDKVLSQKYVTEQLKLRVTSENLQNILLGYVKTEAIKDFLTENQIKELINTYGFKNEEEIKLIKVNNAGTADTATNSTKFASYSLDDFIANVIAKTKVENATNAEQLGGNVASDYVLKLDLEDVVREASEIPIINANTTLIHGWYKTNGETTGLPFESPKEDKNGFLRVLENDNHTRTVLQLFYSLEKHVIYIRKVVNVTVGQWSVLPSINDKDRTSDTTTYSAKQIELILTAPQYSTLIVNVEKVGVSDYQADKSANDILNYVNAGGMVVLKYEEQIYEYQKYESGQAIFHRVDIMTNKADEFDLKVNRDKSIEIVQVTLDVQGMIDTAINTNILKVLNTPR